MGFGGEVDDRSDHPVDIADLEMPDLRLERPSGRSGLRVRSIGILAEAGDQELALAGGGLREAMENGDVLADRRDIECRIADACGHGADIQSSAPGCLARTSSTTAAENRSARLRFRQPRMRA